MATAWYYIEHASVDVVDDSFYFDGLSDVSDMNGLRRYFLDHNRLYCYRDATDEWVRNETANKVTGWAETEDTVAPSPGDMLFWEWQDGAHTQMVIDYNKDLDNRMIFIEGPTIRLGRMDIRKNSMGPANYFFCVGRIPEND